MGCVVVIWEELASEHTILGSALWCRRRKKAKRRVA